MKSEMDEVPVITIDGPSGTGKGTVSAYLADSLGWHMLDSGALYRVLAHAALTRNVPLDNDTELASLAVALDVQFERPQDGNDSVIILNKEDVSEVIRTEECGGAASQIAALEIVRTALLQTQRDFRRMPGLIADGRDMGTVVFPTADVKVFLTASPEERAKRRYKQLKQKGINVNLLRLSMDIATRDARDRERTVSPLKPAVDAIVIDSTNLDVGDVISQVSELARKLLL